MDCFEISHQLGVAVFGVATFEVEENLFPHVAQKRL